MAGQPILSEFKEKGLGFAPIFPDTCYHLTHYWPAAVDIPVASDNLTHYTAGFHCNARSPLQGYAMLFLHSVSA